MADDFQKIQNYPKASFTCYGSVDSMGAQSLAGLSGDGHIGNTQFSNITLGQFIAKVKSASGRKYDVTVTLAVSARDA